MKKFITLVALFSFIVVVPGLSFADPKGPEWIPPGHRYSHHGTPSVDINNNPVNVNVNAPTFNNEPSANATATGGSVTGADANASSGSESNAIVNFPEQLSETTVNNVGSGYRGFAMTPEMTYPGMPAYFGQATRNSNVQPVGAMVMFKDTFTRAEIEEYLGVTTIKTNVTNATRKKSKGSDVITVVLTPPDKSTVTQCGLVTEAAANKNTSSKEVLYAALLISMDGGADIFFVTAEGAGSEVHSFGWGIGLAYTRATLSANEDTGNTASGGMGISGGKAGYHSMPWIQGIALKTK